MEAYTFFGKRKLCYTEVPDYTDFQGIGHDPLYKRYDSVYSVLKRCVPAEYHHFLATPEYLHNEDRVCWYIHEWQNLPSRLCDLQGGERNKYEQIKTATINAYRSAVQQVSGEDLLILAGAIRYIHDEFIYCADGKVFLVAWGMTPDTNKHKVIGAVLHEYQSVKRFKLVFNTGEHGDLKSKADKAFLFVEGTVLSDADAPQVQCHDGWEFAGWQPALQELEVVSDMEFVAQYRERQIVPPPMPKPDLEPEVYYTCRFDAGDKGALKGASVVKKLAGTRLQPNEIPVVTTSAKYKFEGWTPSPNNAQIDENKYYEAQFSKIPWYKRFWAWLVALFTNKSFLRKLLMALLVLLALLLLFLLLKNCSGCSCSDLDLLKGKIVKPIDSVKFPDGSVGDDNGYARPVDGPDGTVPDDGWVAPPVRGEDGSLPPIEQRPGEPDVIANRLIVFLEDKNDNLDAFYKDFKAVYPGDQYRAIGGDKNVPYIIIQVPESERDQIRERLNDQMPRHKFFVLDEQIIEFKRSKTQSRTKSKAAKGWHLKAINLKQGWQITRGSDDVIVAVVDDGIDAKHPMFKGRIVSAYNVFTRNNRLSAGCGHGTHVAGLAAGSADYYDQGAAGVAPNCKIMPIQVFDNGRCLTSSLVAGVMYAVNHDADVVNISVGPSFGGSGLSTLPVEIQDQFAQQRFKNEEVLWTRVCDLAAQKRCILVFAAGNDTILANIPFVNRNKSSITVAAVDQNRQRTAFTNFGICTDISAPGKDIYSAYPYSSFNFMDGTSMAAPIVTGIIALMKSLKKDLTTEQARNCLYNTGADVKGWVPPMVLVDKALKGVQEGRFETPKKRGQPPVPTDNADYPADGYDDPVAGDTPGNPAAPPKAKQPDYDAIRRQIEEHRRAIADHNRAIADLEKQLPEKSKK